VKHALYAALIALFLLHNDTWFADDSRLISGLPIGLVYHIAFCAVATILMALLARFAWPEGLEVDDSEVQS
jgi:hypothetical protein